MSVAFPRVEHGIANGVGGRRIRSGREEFDEFLRWVRWTVSLDAGGYNARTGAKGAGYRRFLPTGIHGHEGWIVTKGALQFRRTVQTCTMRGVLDYFPAAEHVLWQAVWLSLDCIFNLSLEYSISIARSGESLQGAQRATYLIFNLV